MKSYLPARFVTRMFLAVAAVYLYIEVVAPVITYLITGQMHVGGSDN